MTREIFASSGTGGGPARPAARVRERVHYDARTIGPAAAFALAGECPTVRVHSVFPTLVNLRLEGAGAFLTLCGSAGGIFPHAIVLEPAPSFDEWRIDPGSDAFLGDGAIHLRGQTGEVVVELGHALRPPPRPLPRIRRLAGAHRACVAWLARSQQRASCDLRVDALVAPGRRPATSMGVFLCAAALALAEAGRAARKPTPTASIGPAAVLGSNPLALDVVRRAVSALVGLGNGLTPSGDDFLCGFLAATRACDPGAVEMLNAAVTQASARTGELSAFLLRSAASNFWPAPLLDLAEALARDRQGEAGAALARLCGLGHQSGADLATGFLFGLASIAQEAQANVDPPHTGRGGQHHVHAN